MLTKYIRVFTKNGSGELVDISLENQNGQGFMVDFDYLYIAQHYPFLNLFLLLAEKNDPRNVTGSVAVVTPYNAVGPINEIQAVSFDLVRSSGFFKLGYGAETTTEIPFDASGAAVQAALRLLTGLSTVDVVSNATGYLVSFTGIASPSALSVTEVDLINHVLPKFEIDYWNGKDWVEAVDVIDASYGLQDSGLLQCSLNDVDGWMRIATTRETDSSAPAEVRGLQINNCHWMRIALSDEPNPATKIKKLCYAFTTTDCINREDIEGPSYYESYAAGKEDWLEEIISASEEMVLDLKKIGFIKSAGQIIEFDEFYLPAAWKTLSRIYYNLGKAYRDNRATVDAKYESALSSKALTVDSDLDGRINEREINSTSTRFVR